jgi:heme/copper-type cytochrome/quinol oxidase subunit 4
VQHHHRRHHHHHWHHLTGVTISIIITSIVILSGITTDTKP